MPKYKVTEFFPQATVPIVHTVEAEDEEHAYECHNEMVGEAIINEEIDIDYGGEAWTESVELIEESPTPS